MKLDAKTLGRLLYEEFEADSWGDIDVFYLQDPPKADEPSEDCGGMEGLYEVLARVCERINKGDVG